jgi:hypothetical protein
MLTAPSLIIAAGLAAAASTCAFNAHAQPADDDAAWSKATGAGTIAALRSYLKEHPATAHAEEAQMRIIDLMLAAPTNKSPAFNGTWMTTMSCPPSGPALGFTYQFLATVKDGDYHGEKGAQGERGWFSLTGKVDPDGFAGMLASGVVAASAFAAGNAPAGNAYNYHIAAQFTAASGTGKRIEGRVCNVTFTKQ